MDEIIINTVKFLSSTVVVRLLSYPPFAIEIFLAAVVCVVHILLLFEINTLVRRTNSKAAARLRMRHPIKESETSFHSLVTLQTAHHIFQKKPTEMPFYQRPQVFVPVNSRIPPRKMMSSGNFGLILAKGDSSILKSKVSERVEQLLSISPSEYVRRDKERLNREQGLKSCIQSLTSLLEKALENEALEIRNMSKEDIKKSIRSLKENFENQLNSNNQTALNQLCDFPSPSLQSLIEKSSAKRLMENTLSPNLISSIYHTSNTNFTRSMTDIRAKKGKDEKVGFERNKSSVCSLSLKSSGSLSDLFDKQSNDFLKFDRRNVGKVCEGD
ncbi:uncharacterized protein LOC126735601 [Anthonomus grandis grandis]|uniref:uncharacterized protein LOC126735601 n=1 Tax=Anthonomus grandis grandis TaxID=2921223 RepID=UPI0021654AE2|nr:uncharacterized protein LOC126735601 [Anthonomus grandis grandis]